MRSPVHRVRSFCLTLTGSKRLPEAIAPGLSTLGFMLPTTPLHLLMLRRMNCPVVMTSGNVSDEPQVIDDATARERLAGIATYALVHDREIANRVDDLGGAGNGRSSADFTSRPGFRACPHLAAVGLRSGARASGHGRRTKSDVLLVKDGAAILSQHQGDLEDASTFDDYRKNLALYTELFDHAPAALVADQHPEYLSSKLAHEWAQADALPLIEVQHHHAHVAACLAENGHPLDAPAVLGIVLDGLGWGDDGTFWGGEFLLADYRRYERLGTFKPVAMLGWRAGRARTMAQPLRPSHGRDGLGEAFATNFAELESIRRSLPADRDRL